MQQNSRFTSEQEYQNNLLSRMQKKPKLKFRRKMDSFQPEGKKGQTENNYIVTQGIVQNSQNCNSLTITVEDIKTKSPHIVLPS